MMNYVNNTEEQRIVSFCSGYGGIELGLGIAGLNARTVCYVEIEAFAQANLVAKIEEGKMDAAPIWTDLKTFPANKFSGRVHGIIGGYPCQPFSVAGKQLGDKDPRHLWPFIREHIRAIRPLWCFFENVRGHVNNGLREVKSDLEELGYSVDAGIFSAEEVGAPHRRERLFILANARGITSGGLSQPEGRIEDLQTRESSEELGNSRRISKGNKGERSSERESCSQERIGTEKGNRPTNASKGPKLGNSEHNGPFTTEEQGSTEETVRDAEKRKDCSSELERANRSEELADSNNRRGRQDKQQTELRTTGIKQSSISCGRIKEGEAEQIQRWPARPSERQYEWEEPRTIESSMGKQSNEYSSRMDSALTVNGDGNKVRYAKSKTRAREILFELWKEINSKEIQWETRGLLCILKEKVLRSQMPFSNYGKRICYLIYFIQEGIKIQGYGLSGMRINDPSWDSPQGQKPIEQFKRELSYAMCELSYKIALERGQAPLEATGSMQGLWESWEAEARNVSEALPEMEEAWKSTINEVFRKEVIYESITTTLGFNARVDQLRLLGNGVVPQTAAKAWITLNQQYNA